MHEARRIAVVGQHLLQFATGQRRCRQERGQGADAHAGRQQVAQHQAVVDGDACRQGDRHLAIGAEQRPAAR
ncbi:hypothetical protein G6F32_015277 [Rhizopus arrhizus]|nr:hypothetical protein G6F32_015277 [Rhizopus arrhizus]